MSRVALRIDLTAGYGKQTVLKRAALELGAGERVGLVGTSGAGKSTLTLAALGLLPLRRGWARGVAEVDGKNLIGLAEREARALRGKVVSLVPQSAMTALNGAMSLLAHFEEAWRAHEKRSFNEMAERVQHLMKLVQLPVESSFLARRPGEVSVGQAQRVALALALLHAPKVLIADEVTSALDPLTQAEILEVLHQASAAGNSALLYISHDLLSVLQLCDRLAVLHEGELVEIVPVQGIEAEAKHPVTRALLQTLPVSPRLIRSFARQALNRISTGRKI